MAPSPINPSPPPTKLYYVGQCRTCNGWVEQMSSSGKLYYYQQKTEVSQWHPPNEWTLSSPPDLQKWRDTVIREAAKQCNYSNSSYSIEEVDYGIRSSKAHLTPLKYPHENYSNPRK
ncbi:hypothetical protein B9Z55_027212 [Caenorhabditis nigoni]|uniref:WW domain-containing protein n=1 Tax=Caenorhabditis nigoni TaxID=1611254 RepID=A0A2G5SGK0_9PELO|nr:hypothetical protein B9Z55_027212 [Caenorhabditis nigoni]